MNPLGSPDAQESTCEIYMSEFDKRSIRLLGVLFLSGIVALLLLSLWTRELCRRQLGFGKKVFSAMTKDPRRRQKQKKLN